MRSALAALLLFLCVCPIKTSAQTAPLDRLVLPLGIDSGYVEAPSSARGPTVIFETEISGNAAPWMRLRFADMLLAGDPNAGTGSFLRLVSLLDGAQQTLDRGEILQWSESSAYFNGDALRVELVAFPGTGLNRVTIPTATVGAAETGASRYICGEGDERVPSNDPRVARLLPVGCSAFLIEKGGCANRFLTAGHCSFYGELEVVEFNVPLSLPSGAIQHPPPEHQYPVDPDSIQGVFLGTDGDYGTFLTFESSETGLPPRIVQGSAFVFAPNAPRTEPELWLGIRITGYGADTGEANFTQQKAEGIYFGRKGNEIQHFVDTNPGNSGGPIIYPIDDTVIGIHTQGGCHHPDANFMSSGNYIYQRGLVRMLADGPMGTCWEI